MRLDDDIPANGGARVAVVCVEPVWEAAVSWLLRGAGCDVVGHVRDVERAEEVVADTEADVLVVDADREEIEPARLYRRIRDVRELRPATRVVAICRRTDHASHDAAVAAGARVVLREDALGLVDAVEHARPTDEGAAARLTLRQVEILRLVGEGRTNREVGRALWVTEETVKFHLANIYRRLSVHGRRDAIAWAVENGIVTEPPAAPARASSSRRVPARS
ncbi:MAG TPA: LuxR C-terminal-related transcriptional regulator [Gaiellaceae bacterium]